MYIYLYIYILKQLNGSVMSIHLTCCVLPYSEASEHAVAMLCSGFFTQNVFSHLINHLTLACPNCQHTYCVQRSARPEYSKPLYTPRPKAVTDVCACMCSVQ